MIKTITITKQGEVCDKCGEELKPMMNVTWKDKRYCTRCFNEMEEKK